MSFKRFYIKFNNGAVFNYTDPDGFEGVIGTSNIIITVNHPNPDQQFQLTFARSTIAFFRYDQVVTGNGTE